MLGFAILKAKNDIIIKEKENQFIFKKDSLYTGTFDFSDIKIYDERDNAISLNYVPSCFKTKEHYSKYFDFICKNEAENKKHFFKIRKYLRNNKNMVVGFESFLKNEEKKSMLKAVANYIQDNAENRCDFCKYDICSEHDDCFEGILEKLVENIYKI